MLRTITGYTIEVSSMTRSSIRLNNVLHWSLLILILVGCVPLGRAQTIQVDITPDHVRNVFRPTEAFGAGVDRIPLAATDKMRSEEHTSELQSQSNLVCRLLLEKKKTRQHK